MKKAKLTRFLILWVTPLFFLVVLAVSEGFSGWNSIPASVEEVTRESEIIVLGKVIATDPVGIRVGKRNRLHTRHSFLVEKYFLGEGPKKISLLTVGGVVMKRVGDEIHPIYTRALGSEQVKKGEEMLAFLRKGPGEGFLC